MKRIGEHPKNIASLESLWYGDIEDSLNVGPILEIVARMHGLKTVHLTCNTRNEFVNNLRLVKRRPGYGIVYLAFHGRPATIIFADDSLMTLEDLSHYMGKGFTDWVIHFGACGTVDTEPSRLSEFIQQTGISMVSGYTNKYVDWIESASMDLLFLQLLQHHSDMGILWSEMESRYGGLISITGLKAFLPATKSIADG